MSSVQPFSNVARLHSIIMAAKRKNAMAYAIARFAATSYSDRSTLLIRELSLA